MIGLAIIKRKLQRTTSYVLHIINNFTKSVARIKKLSCQNQTYNYSVTSLLINRLIYPQSDF